MKISEATFFAEMHGGALQDYDHALWFSAYVPQVGRGLNRESSGSRSR